MVIKIKDSTDGQFFYTLEGGNGEILVTSEMFTRKERAISGARALIEGVFKMMGISLPDNTWAGSDWFWDQTKRKNRTNGQSKNKAGKNPGL
jgi:uncharacterized protein YegP (UPF0339 family)